MNTRKIGANKETVAAQYLAAQGMQILEQNFYTRQGEIDIIGRHGAYLVFVEVKYRADAQHGDAAEAVDYRKQCRICKAADYYRYRQHIGDQAAVRYDVLAIQGEEIRWIQNAFPHRFTRGIRQK